MIVEKPVSQILSHEVAPTPETPEQKEIKRGKLTAVKIIVGAFFVVAIIAFGYRAVIDRKIPRTHTSESDTALRGNIITQDGFVLATSEKFYKAVVDSRSIDPNKRELFVKLYSIYSGESEAKINAALNKKGFTTLSNDLDRKSAAFVKDLGRKFYQTGVFIAYENPESKRAVTRGMDVVQSGQRRNYIAADALTPLIGYTQQRQNGELVRNVGVKGIEGFYNANLSATTDGKIVGNRDVGGNLIYTKHSVANKREDGQDVILNINFDLQIALEKIVSDAAKEFEAKEVIVAVMQAQTGKILALASSARFNPSRIKKEDYPHLNVAAVEFAFEPGSVIKPFVFAALLQNRKLDAFEPISIGGGAMRIGSNIIRDSHPYDQLYAEDILTVSSNIGMVRLIERLNSKEILAGLGDFGFGIKSGADIAYELSGYLPAQNSLEKSVMDRASLSFGYGMSATFMQILAAYNVFNNDGKFVTPRVASALSWEDGRFEFASQSRQVLREDVAWEMKRILEKVVSSPRGTARRAQIGGVKLGGKTGTAHINEKGAYVKRYNASFFGFASDTDGHSYTLGVLVREPAPVNYRYYGARSAIPVFKKAVETLVEAKLLNVDEVMMKQEIKHTGSDILD